MEDINTQDDELFDRYLREEMTDAERQAFERRLAAEPALRDDFELHRKVAEGVSLHLRKAEIGDIGRRALRRQWRRKWVWRILGIALLSLVAAGGIWYFRQEEVPPETKQSQRPGPQVSTEQPAGESVSGAKKGAIYNIEKTASRLQIINGQRTESAGKTYDITVLEASENQAVALVEGTEIRLFFHADRIPAKDRLELIELELAGKKGLYLYDGTHYFELPENGSRRELTAVNDPAVSDWLR